MYKLLKKLYRHIEVLQNNTSDFCLVITQVLNEEETSCKLPVNISISKGFNMGILLEAILLSSPNFKNQFIVDLENKYSSIIQQLAIAYHKYLMDEVYLPSLEEHYDQLSSVLHGDIDNINEFCHKYFDVPKDKQLTFDHYQTIAKAQVEYNVKKERINYLKVTKDFSEDEELDMIMSEVSTEEWLNDANSIELDFDNYQPNEYSTLLSNNSLIKSGNFNVSFISEPMHFSLKPKLDDHTISKLWHHLLSCKLIQNVNLEHFSFFVRNHTLPTNLNKFMWLKQKTDACRLVNFLGINYSIFNNCFDFPNNKKLNKTNEPKKDDYSDLTRFLESLN